MHQFKYPTAPPLMSKFIISLSVACILSIYPVPDWVGLIEPPWLILMLIFWTIFGNSDDTMLGGFFCGLLLDELYFTALGMHNLIILPILYLLSYFQLQVRMFSILQQTSLVFCLIILYKVLLCCIHNTFLFHFVYWRYWFSAVGSMFFWPGLTKIFVNPETP